MAEMKKKIITDEKPMICPDCKISMTYKYAGIYVCPECGFEDLDDFGKIRRYIEEHGPTNAIELSENTGVRKSKIGEFLRLGKVEIPEGSDIFIHCKSCGVPIRFGDYCERCVHAKNIEGAYIGDVAKNPSANSKMRFLDND